MAGIDFARRGSLDGAHEVSDHFGDLAQVRRPAGDLSAAFEKRTPAFPSKM
ncbi:MAG: hypothetical protein AB7P97_06600 [Hyphomonadaceae bacterium]